MLVVAVVAFVVGRVLLCQLPSHNEANALLVVVVVVFVVAPVVAPVFLVSIVVVVIVSHVVVQVAT